MKLFLLVSVALEMLTQGYILQTMVFML